VALRGSVRGHMKRASKEGVAIYILAVHILHPVLHPVAQLLGGQFEVDRGGHLLGPGGGVAHYETGYICHSFAFLSSLSSLEPSSCIEHDVMGLRIILSSSITRMLHMRRWNRSHTLPAMSCTASQVAVPITHMCRP